MPVPSSFRQTGGLHVQRPAKLAHAGFFSFVSSTAGLSFSTMEWLTAEPAASDW